MKLVVCFGLIAASLLSANSWGTELTIGEDFFKVGKGVADTPPGETKVEQGQDYVRIFHPKVYGLPISDPLQSWHHDKFGPAEFEGLCQTYQMHYAGHTHAWGKERIEVIDIDQNNHFTFQGKEYYQGESRSNRITTAYNWVTSVLCTSQRHFDPSQANGSAVRSGNSKAPSFDGN